MHRKRARGPARAGGPTARLRAVGTLSVHIAEFKKRGKKGVKKTLRITLRPTPIVFIPNQYSESSSSARC